MLLLDNSAWSRRLKAPVRERFSAVMRERLFVVTVPFLLEAGYSARSQRDHMEILRDVGPLPQVVITPDVERLAVAAQSDLACVGHHRLRPIDVLIAACAHDADGGVLHYDRDYDVLHEHTRLRFRSEWLAPAGSLD
jgi:predicted nucleic acid-binding protein